MAKKAPPRRMRGYADGGEVQDTDYGKAVRDPAEAQISSNSLGSSIGAGFSSVIGAAKMAMNKGGKVRKVMKKGVRRGR